MQPLPHDHVHSHLISTPQKVKFCKANGNHTYAEVAWFEESTPRVFRKTVFSVKKYGVMEAYKLAHNFRNSLIAIEAERMKKFVVRVQTEMKMNKTNQIKG